MCVGTSQQPSTKFPLLVTLPLNAHPDVIPFHVVIWQPQETISPTENSATSPHITSRCWLACAPVAHESLAPVHVNGRRLALPTLRPFSSDCRPLQPISTLHWLAPGDTIQLGSSGRSRFRIWPGPNPPSPPKSSPPLSPSSGARTNGPKKLTVR